MGNNVIAGLNARRAYKGWTWQFLAEQVHKDVNTVKKQLDGTSNLTLATVDEYTAVLGGRLCYETDEALQAIDDADVNQLRIKITELANKIERLNEKLEEKDKTIADLRELNHSMQAQLIKCTGDISRKDKKLAELIDSVISLTEKVVEKI